MLKRRLSLMVLASALCLFSAVPKAKATDDNLKSYEYASAQEVVDGMMTKMARGVANVSTGWLELPKQVYVTGKEDGVAKAVLVGPLKGVGMTVVRTVAGVIEIGTFILPFPGFYRPVIEPGYVWQKE